MHRRLATAGVTGTVLLTLLATGAPAVAGPVQQPAPPAWSTELDTAQPGDDAFLAATPTCSNVPRELPVSEFTDHRELGIELDRIERAGAGRVQVDQIGQSNRGREIWAARAGHGPTAVLLTSEIHGNEKTGTDALVDLLDWMATSDSAKAQQWRDELTVVAVPKMNPDGAELDRRGNDQTWEEVVAANPQLRGAEPAWNYYTEQIQGDDYAARPGFDTNRDYRPDLSYVPQAADFPGSSPEPGWFITPEAQTIRDLYRGLQTEFGEVDTYVDLHHQGACYVMPDDPDEFVTMSISGRFVDDPAGTPGYEQYAELYDLDYAKQLNVAVYAGLQDAAEQRPVFGNITLYPQETNLPGTGLGSFALNGSGSVLFEVRGQTQTLGQEQRATLTRTVYIGLDAMLTSVASGEVEQLDPAVYDSIPERGEDIGTGADNADEGGADEGGAEGAANSAGASGGAQGRS